MKKHNKLFRHNSVFIMCTGFFTVGVIFVLLFFSYLMEGCSLLEHFDQVEQVDFILPVWPPSYGNSDLYPELSRWLVTVEGQNVNQHFSIEGNSDIKSYSLEAVKNMPLCITVQPVTINESGEETVFFKCAGAVYPYGKEQSEKLAVTWEDGFTADLMKNLYQGAKENGLVEKSVAGSLAAFNWKKLMNGVRDKIAEGMDAFALYDEPSFYNPWLTDKQGILEGIAYNNFKSSLYNTSSVFTISPDLSDYGFIVHNPQYQLLSSFIPENEIIYSYGKITVKSNEVNLFSLYNIYGVIFQGKTADKLLPEFIYLPIFIEDI